MYKQFDLSLRFYILVFFFFFHDYFVPMKYIKRLIAALIGLIVIIGTILWVLSKTVNPETVNHFLGSQLHHLTGMPSKIEGDISWQLFPHPGIKIKGIQIGDQAHPANYAVHLDNVLFNLQITPVIQGKLVFNEVNIDGFTISVSPHKRSDAVATTQPAHEASNNPSDHFAVKKVLLAHGEVVINNAGSQLKLGGLQIGAEEVNLNNIAFPIQFKSNLDFSKPGEKILQAHFNFKGSTSLSAALLANPVASLPDLVTDGQLFVQKIRFNQLKLNKISAHLKNKEGLLQLNPLSLHLYDGESVGDLSYESARKLITINQTATNLNGAKLFQDLVHKAILKGRVDFSIHGQLPLNTSNWQEKSSATGNFSIKDGVIETLDLNKIINYISMKINLLIQNKKPDINQLLDIVQFNDTNWYKGSTPFNLLNFQYHIQNDLLSTDSLVLQTDTLLLKGQGRVNLNTEAIDTSLSIRINQPEKETAKAQQLLGGSFPLRIKGSITEPQVLPDIQKINPLLAKEWIKDVLDKPLRKINDKLDKFLKKEF